MEQSDAKPGVQENDAMCDHLTRRLRSVVPVHYRFAAINVKQQLRKNKRKTWGNKAPGSQTELSPVRVWLETGLVA